MHYPPAKTRSPVVFSLGLHHFDSIFIFAFSLPYLSVKSRCAHVVPVRSCRNDCLSVPRWRVEVEIPASFNIAISSTGRVAEYPVLICRGCRQQGGPNNQQNDGLEVIDPRKNRPCGVHANASASRIYASAQRTGDQILHPSCELPGRQNLMLRHMRWASS